MIQILRISLCHMFQGHYRVLTNKLFEKKDGKDGGSFGRLNQRHHSGL